MSTASTSCRSPSSVIRYRRGRSRISSAKIAMSYRRGPRGNRIRLARSLTIASNPAPSTAPNQRTCPSGPVSRARSTARVRPCLTASAIPSAAASGATGTPTSAAKSLPVPAGTTPNGMPVPATARGRVGQDADLPGANAALLARLPDGLLPGLLGHAASVRRDSALRGVVVSAIQRQRLGHGLGRGDRLPAVHRGARLDGLRLVLQRRCLVVVEPLVQGVPPAPPVVEERHSDRAEVQQ